MQARASTMLALRPQFVQPPGEHEERNPKEDGIHADQPYQRQSTAPGMIITTMPNNSESTPPMIQAHSS